MSATTPRARAILQSAAQGSRIAPDEARLLFDEASLIDLGLAADAARRRLHPQPMVTYIVDRNINYTNFCVTKCSFCAFYRLPGDSAEGYVHPKEILYRKIEETLELGGPGSCCREATIPLFPWSGTRISFLPSGSAIPACTCTPFPLRRSSISCM